MSMSGQRILFALGLLLAATAHAAPIVYGVNAHDNRPAYAMTQAEARFKLLAARNLRSYRFDVDPAITPRSTRWFRSRASTASPCARWSTR